MKRARFSLAPLLVGFVIAVSARVGFAEAPTPRDGLGGDIFPPLPGVLGYLPDDAPSLSRETVLLLPPARTGVLAFFRYLPDGPWIAFDRSLALSAASGEDRTYRLEIATVDGSGRHIKALSVRIDKQPPAPPQATPASGVVNDTTALSLAAGEGDVVYYALVGCGDVAFARFDPAHPPRLSPPTEGVRSLTLITYAEDAAGNRSEALSVTYRLAAPGVPLSPPSQEGAFSRLRADPLPELAAPRVEVEPGRTRLSLAVPEGASLFAAVNPGSPLGAMAAYAPLATSGGRATLELESPYGYEGEARIYFALATSEGLRVRPSPIVVRLAHPAASMAAALSVPPPGAPRILRGPPGAAAVLAFPSYEGRIFASVGGAPFEELHGPLTLAPGEGTALIHWYGLRAGARSEEASLAFARPAVLPAAFPLGVEDGAVYRAPPRLYPSDRGVLRYLFTRDGSIPPEPDARAPRLIEGVTLPCAEGEDICFVLRYRAFAGDGHDAPGGDGGIIRFRVDRLPPEPPRLEGDSPLLVARPLELRFAQGADTVYASVSADGVAAPFLPVGEHILLPGSPEGPVTYIVRAYAVDKAGNRSREMEARRFTVDMSAIYVDADQTLVGDGSPERPFRSLAAAIAEATASGRRWVRLRGEFSLAEPLSVSRPLALAGGYGADWRREDGARARLSFTLAGASALGASARGAESAGASGAAFALAVSGASLAIESVDLDVHFARSGTAIVAQDASIALSSATLAVDAGGDAIACDLVRSRLSLAEAALTAARARSAQLIHAESSAVMSASAVFRGDEGLRFFSVAKVFGGSFESRASVFASRGALGVALLEVRSSRLAIERSLFEIEGGQGFFTLVRCADVDGLISNSRMECVWDGPASLFESEGRTAAFVHNSVLVCGRPGGLRFFGAKDGVPIVRNSLLQAPSGGAELLSTDRVPSPGDLAANCLYGFARLVSGAVTITTLEGLAALNASSAFFSSYPSVSEPPEKSYAPALKGMKKLRADSACVGAALPLEGFSVDFSGLPRPGPMVRGPTIGADEYRP